jgi:hypothetical protein
VAGGEGGKGRTWQLSGPGSTKSYMPTRMRLSGREAQAQVYRADRFSTWASNSDASQRSPSSLSAPTITGLEGARRVEAGTQVITSWAGSMAETAHEGEKWAGQRRSKGLKPPLLCLQLLLQLFQLPACQGAFGADPLHSRSLKDHRRHDYNCLTCDPAILA